MTGRAWVFHRGSLGDSVLLWPALRAIGPGATLVTDSERGRLASRFLGVAHENIERAQWNALWIPERGVSAHAGEHGARPADRAPPREDVDLVVTFLADPGTPSGAAWLSNAARAFPRARIEPVRGPLDRRSALAIPFLPADPMRARAEKEPRRESTDPTRSVVLHVGAGAKEKRWPMERWAELARELPPPVRVIAGEVERERFEAGERLAFDALEGEWVDSLDRLADVLERARLVVSADTGPGHLAAQLGARVLSLFGPTDPDRWAPIGPRVRVLAPSTPRAMDWLGVERVVDAIRCSP